jgi:hypothetical protein
MSTHDRDVLLRTQSFERYMHHHGAELIRTYNAFNGHKLREVQVYINPHEGKLHADVVLDNGARIPLLVDIDPRWEMADLTKHENADLEQFQRDFLREAADERKVWDT